MCAFETRAPPSAATSAIRFLHRARRQLLLTLALFKESRLGLAGLCIVVAFALIAVLAPFISPYPRDFEAPEEDRFTVSLYPRDLPPGLMYNAPVMGPTTPLSSDKQGGMWLINSARQGTIYMDFLRHTLATNASPFQAGNISLTLGLADDFRALNLQPNLTAVYYIVPAVNSSQQSGPGTTNGAIAFFSGRDFVVADPFSRSVIFHDELTFDPLWTGEDPASAGGMFIRPLERIGSIGVLTFDVGPYRYFYAADGNHVAVFEITYVNIADNSPPSGRRVLTSTVQLSAPPFVYYNQGYVDEAEQFRSGSGQAILLPLANNTLEVHNVSGKLRAWLPLRLGGEPAHVAGAIGFVRSPFPMLLYLPLRSSSSVGLAALDLAALTIRWEVALPNPTWEPLGTPVSYRGNALYTAFFDPTEGPSGTTHLVGVNQTGGLIPQFRADVPGRVRNYFEVYERSQVFIFTEGSEILTMPTTFKGSGPETPEHFAIIPPRSTQFVGYAGALGGTLYGDGLIPQELYGVWVDSAQAKTAVFQLLGTIRTPLPPGTYPSGNRYILGTDFRGRDILTQLFWGTQVAFIVGLLAALVAVGIGTLVGLIAGYFGKIADTLLMRTADIFLVLPFLPIVLILASILRPSIWIIIVVIGIVGWPGIARVIRAQVLTLKQRPFIDAARVSGASDTRLIFYHLAPNVLPFSFLYMSLGVAGAIITEAALSFLGLGDASVISWGGMLSQVLTFGGALSAWWWLLPPGLAITLLSLGFYMLGRGFDEVINPRLRRR